MCCFCWTAFRRHKQKSGCVFVFPTIWQLFMPSCWAVASGCPVSYGCACYDRGKQKQLLLFQVIPSYRRKLTLFQVLLLCMCVTILPQQQAGPIIRNRQFIWNSYFEEFYPVWSHWAFSTLIPELLESTLRAAVRHFGARVTPSPANHSSAMSLHTLPPPPMPPGQLPPWMWTLHLSWWEKQAVESLSSFSLALSPGTW